MFDVPLVFKNPIVFSLNIPILAANLPTAVFIICRRDPRYVAQSTLLSRLKYHGRKDRWFSIKPKEYPQLKNLSYERQIAGQIHYTEKQIQQSLAEIDKDRYVIINYCDLCRDPQHEVERIWELLARRGYRLDRTDFSPLPFENRNRLRVSREEFQRLENAINAFKHGQDTQDSG